MTELTLNNAFKWLSNSNEYVPKWMGTTKIDVRHADPVKGRFRYEVYTDRNGRFIITCWLGAICGNVAPSDFDAFIRHMVKAAE